MEALQKLKTFNDACKIEGIDPKKAIPDFAGYPKSDRKAMIAHAKLVIVIKAANRIANNGKPWKPNWDDNNWKYYAWFRLDGGSSGFRFDDVDYWNTSSYVGSRLCFVNGETCRYVANQFIKLYKEYFR